MSVPTVPHRLTQLKIAVPCVLAIPNNTPYRKPIADVLSSKDILVVVTKSEQIAKSSPGNSLSVLLLNKTANRVPDIRTVTLIRRIAIFEFLVGIALASLSVGVAFVSGWYPQKKQGMALGVYGAGNIGQSLAAYFSPLLAGALGFVWGFQAFAILLTAWLFLFAFAARNAPVERFTTRERGPRTWMCSTLTNLQGSKLGPLQLSPEHFSGHRTQIRSFGRPNSK